MSGRYWYVAQCLSCQVEPTYFDVKYERDESAANHVQVTGHEDMSVWRTQVAPTSKPRVNCVVCVQLGTSSTVTHTVFGFHVCADHVVPMQISGSEHHGKQLAQITVAVGIARMTNSIGKQED